MCALSMSAQQSWAKRNDAARPDAQAGYDMSMN